ncbi:MAG: hypothetical protein M1827_000625 [Pycnora praestabilis]|nr:MAG: hypothetical protein M1827_000625 [Pycnora praestabilis]
MDGSVSLPVGRPRRSSSQVQGRPDGKYTQLYRRDSNMSDASFMTDVEMAHDEVFAGPMSESVPSSTTSFAHRRYRADSTTSFTYFQESEDPSEYPEDEAVIDESDEEDGYAESDADVESGQQSPMRRKSSGYSRNSAENSLLRRHESLTTEPGSCSRGGRLSQKIHIVTEDLTIVVAGFKTSHLGFALYGFLCFASLGLGYLLFRWLPRWRIRLVGSPTPLWNCSWVVIEVSLYLGRNKPKSSAKASQNQWGEFTVHDVVKCWYGQSLSTVFGYQEKDALTDMDEDDDPIMNDLRFIDYRYIRFCFHPLRDKFVLSNSWKDPAWTDVRSIRAGIDGNEKEHRERVFGSNTIDIEQKTIPQLLIDEVCTSIFDQWVIAHI